MANPFYFMLLVLLLGFSNVIYAQADSARSEQLPEFSGEVAMYKFIQENMVYPAEAIRSDTLHNDTLHIVYVGFIITPKGKIRKVRVLQEIGSGCSEEALRVVKAMPRFEPPKYNGKEAKVRVTLPIRFVLSDE